MKGAPPSSAAGPAGVSPPPPWAGGGTPPRPAGGTPALHDAARRAGFTRFELMATLPGVPLYLACGYEPVEETQLDLPDGVRIGAVRMERRSIGER